MRKKIGSMFLVAGTCIGGGMLGLPVVTGRLGFLPATAALVVVWAMMTLTSLLYLEVCLTMDRGSHLVTMSSKLLGPWVKRLNGILFLFVTYASLVAYAYGGGAQLAEVVEWPLTVGQLFFIAGLGLFLFWKAAAVERVNSTLFFGMLIAYLLLVVIGHDDVTLAKLSHQEWDGWLSAFPILLAAFSFQIFLVPTIAEYLEYDGSDCRQALIGGTLVTMAFYLVWEWLVIGTVPLDQLQLALANDDPATSYFSHAVSSPLVATVAQFFAFFAVATSFLGMCLGLQDFLADTLSIEKKGVGMVWLAGLVLLPTFFCSVYFENVFTTALDMTGGFGDTMINGMIPVALIWVIRYRRNLETECRVCGGKPLLIFTFLFYLAILVEDTYRTFYAART